MCANPHVDLTAPREGARCPLCRVHLLCSCSLSHSGSLYACALWESEQDKKLAEVEVEGAECVTRLGDPKREC